MTWKFAFRNLFRNSRRSLATGVAILVGFVGLVLLGGFLFRFENTLKTQAIYLKYKGHLSFYKTEALERFANDPERFELKPDDVAAIRELLTKYQDRIEWIGLGLTGVGLMSNGVKSTPAHLTSVDVETLQRVQLHPSVQMFAQDFITPEDSAYAQAVGENPLAVSMSTRMGELLNLKPPFSELSVEARDLQLAGISVYGDLNAVNTELVSSHSTGSEFFENTSLLGPLPLAQELFQTEGVQTLMVFLKDSSDTHTLLSSLQSDLKEKNLGLEVYPFDLQAISPNYVGSMGFLYVMAGFFLFLICGAVILSIINSLTMGILERVREIGTLRALGYRRVQISWMLTQESILLTSLASVLGAALALIVSWTINQMNFQFTPPGAPKSIQFSLTPEWFFYVLAFLLFLILSAGASYVMSYYKMNTKVIDLLSDTGA